MKSIELFLAVGLATAIGTSASAVNTGVYTSTVEGGERVNLSLAFESSEVEEEGLRGLEGMERFEDVETIEGIKTGESSRNDEDVESSEGIKTGESYEGGESIESVEGGEEN